MSRPACCRAQAAADVLFQSPSEIFGEPAEWEIMPTDEKDKFQSPSEIFGEPASP